MRRRIAATALGLTWLAGGGCAANLSFDSPSPLGSGVEGKYWYAPYFVDAPLYIPEPLTISTQFPVALDFAAASYGNNIQLVGSWWDASSAQIYRGYARLYQDGLGWSALGPNFGQVASDVLDSFSSVTVAGGANGLFAANFFDGISHPPFSIGEPLDGASAYYSGSSWQLAVNNSAGLGGVFAHVPNPGTNVASTMDALGRGFIFYTDLSAVYETQWGLANPTGVTSTAGVGTFTVPSGAVQANTPINAIFDGVSQVCTTYVSSTGGSSGTLNASCQDIACTGPYAFSGSFASTTMIDTAVFGQDTATDGLGNIMAVYYKSGQVWARLGSFSGSCTSLPIAAESWGTAIQLDQQIQQQVDQYGTKIIAPSAAQSWPQGTHPGVTYVGNGRFLATWVGVYISTVPSVVPNSTQIYSILYDPALGGWQGLQTPTIPGSLQMVPGSNEPYTTIPHAQQLVAFGNGAGNAGFAINNLVTTDVIPPPIAPAMAPFSIYPESAQVRTVKLDRWQEDDGWVSDPPISFGPIISAGAVSAPGVTCFNFLRGTQASSTPVPSGGELDCTHPPIGLILPSGDTVVFFQAQDNYSQTPGAKIPWTGTNSPSGSSIPGNRRVMAVEFR